MWCSWIIYDDCDVQLLLEHDVVVMGCIIFGDVFSLQQSLLLIIVRRLKMNHMVLPLKRVAAIAAVPTTSAVVSPRSTSSSKS